MQSEFLNARSLLLMGRAIVAMRRRRGWTQAELAKQAGVSRPWLSELEHGRTFGVELGRVMRVLDALDASLYVHDDLGGDG